MATVCLVGTELYLGGKNRSAEMDQFALQYTSAGKDITTFGDKGTRRRRGTRKDATIEISGFCDFASADFGDVGGAGNPSLLITDPTGADLAVVEGDIAYMANMFSSKLDIGDAVSEIAPFSLTLGNLGTAPLARGPLVSVTAGAVTAEVQPVTNVPHAVNQVGIVICTVAITPGGAGGNINVSVDSDSDAGFASPITRHASGAVATAGTEYMSFVDLGLFTGEDYWRATVTADAAVTSMYVAVGVYIPTA